MDRVQSRIEGESAGTRCIACNQGEGKTYRLRLHRRDGTHVDIEARLCDDCIKSHLEFEWIEPLISMDD